VHVVVVGPAEARASTAALVRELLSEIDARVELEERDELDVREVVWPDSDAPASARVWIDLTDSRGAVVYIADRHWERILVRTVPFSGGIDVAAREEVAQIVRASVEALLAGAQIGLSRRDAAAQLGVEDHLPTPSPRPRPDPKPTPAPLQGVNAPPPSDRPPVVALAGVGYRIQPWQTDQPPLHGPLLSLRAWYDGPLLIGGAVDLAFGLPQRVTLGTIETRLWGADLIGSLSVGGFVARRVSLHAEIGSGVTTMRARNRGTAASAEPAGAHTRVLPIFAVALGPTFWLGRGRHHVVISTRAGAQAELVDFRVQADAGALQFDPWRIRPTFDLTVGYGFL
jgi:hypothetical protein